MTIRTKLQFAFVAKAALVALVAGMSIRSLWHTSKTLEETNNTSIVEVGAINAAASSADSITKNIEAFEQAMLEHRIAQAVAIKASVESDFRQIETSIKALRLESETILKSFDSQKDIDEEKTHLAKVDDMANTASAWHAVWMNLSAEVRDSDEEMIRDLAISTDDAHRLLSQSLQLQQAAHDEIAEVLTESVDDVRSRLYWTFFTGVAAMILAGAISWLTIRPIARRLSELRSVAQEVGKGNLDARLPLENSDEITELANTFNQMTQSLATSREELIESAKRALAASKAKTSFLANMSHEIRTPMTAIVGYAEVLQDPAQPEATLREATTAIRRSANHLLNLINDILDISKIEAEKMTVENIEMDLPQLAVEVVSILRPRAAAKCLRLDLAFAGPVPKIIRSDPLRLKQIMMNLLGNAIKFTQAGSVTLRISSLGNEKELRVRFDVIDTGIGIGKEEIGRLFQPFTQADDSMSRRFGGTGLGLAISKKLAELLGGNITVRSETGIGSTFSVEISGGGNSNVLMLTGLTEAMLCSAAIHAPTAEIQPLKARILLAEDGPDNRRLISLHLRQAGADVDLAENGKLALELAQRQTFDLIVMDMQMPEMDGYAATRELRRRGYTLPIIALTAHAMAEDRAKCIEAGCTDYMTKPVDKQILLRTLAKYLPNTQRDEVAACPSAPARSASGTIHSTFAADPDMIEAINEFVSALPARVTAINDLLNTEHLEELKRMVHQLKGAGGGYGFDPITKQAARADLSLKNSAPLSAIKADVDALISVIRSVENYQLNKEKHDNA